MILFLKLNSKCNYLLSAHGVGLELYYGLICILRIESFRYKFFTMKFLTV